MNNLEKTNFINRLIDFYGGLLKDKQYSYISKYYAEDLSLTEIAENAAVSRQAVLENIQRTTRQLKNYEEVLHLLSIEEKRSQLLHQLKKINSENMEAQELICKIQRLDD